jgi:hypothetical protein
MGRRGAEPLGSLTSPETGLSQFHGIAEGVVRPTLRFYRGVRVFSSSACLTSHWRLDECMWIVAIFWLMTVRTVR